MNFAESAWGRDNGFETHGGETLEDSVQRVGSGARFHFRHWPFVEEQDDTGFHVGEDVMDDLIWAVADAVQRSDAPSDHLEAECGGF
jgi:hypothetical protein